MKLKLIRKYKKQDYTIGKLYIDDKYFADTLEDADRGLNSKMSSIDITRIKIKGITAIPTGTYQITLNVQSPKYSNFSKYPYVKFCNGKMPRLLNVPGFDGVLIHAGNTHKDTDGCILVGENKEKGKVLNSQNTWRKLYDILDKNRNNLTIEII